MIHRALEAGDEGGGGAAVGTAHICSLTPRGGSYSYHVYKSTLICPDLRPLLLNITPLKNPANIKALDIDLGKTLKLKYSNEGTQRFTATPNFNVTDGLAIFDYLLAK